MIRQLLLFVTAVTASVVLAAAQGQESGSPLVPVVVEEVAPPSGAPALDWQALPPDYGRYYSSAALPINPLCVKPTCHTGRHGMDVENGAGHSRIKLFLQRSHWGFCNHFDERPFGDANMAMLSGQVHKGAEDLLVLYHVDFFPPGGSHEGELTPRGRQQLLKMFFRIRTMPAPITIQIVDNQAELNRNRMRHVAEALASFGLDHPEHFVLLGPQVHGGVAVEAMESQANMLNSVRDRGRTIQGGEQPTFGSNSSGFGN